MKKKFHNHALTACLITGVLISPITKSDVAATMFGTVNVGIKHSDRIVRSYGKDVLVAPTEAGPMTVAGNLDYDFYSSQPRTAIQSAQSKFGWNFKANDSTSGVLELDMVDFEKGAPTTHILRVRKASFQHLLSEESKIRIGKDFTIFNGVGPHTSNWVGGSYRAGNTGFILDELVYFRKISSWELAAAIGNFGRNLGEATTATEIPAEFSFPSATLRLEQKSEFGRWGLAYMGSQGAKWESRSPTQNNTQAHASKIYADLNAWNANWRLSAYQGTNTNDLALLGLATSKQGTQFVNLQEAGAFLSVQHNLSDARHLYWGLSYAQIQNPEIGLAANAIRSNQVSRIGYKQELEKNLVTFIEFTEFRSGYSAAASSQDINTAKATLGHAGFLYNF